ncbi:type IV conjugative transfer system coupling protein TraD [Pantoea agglomerans]|uniref:type IV conjugative transfer system coupling protein TraD n=1 Tax=Enterobacter agglomerans TaxID=549 RepID=UPI00117D91BF|nr:type IV conjugative transfer system coupling protein TraD [Pantoea agglomerans]NKE96716.1 type IV conjugative transfer system coupling protein TraD [Pantoea agglomerans]TRO70071.1 type IV conjugative transfer system coupling protein TraD [Pantoea agglomerans]
MSFTPKYLTQGGQMTAYRLRMFAQVSNWIFHWMLLLFVIATGVLFWLTTPDDVLRNGFWYWAAWPSHSLLSLSPRAAEATWDILWHCDESAQLCTIKLTPAQLLVNPWMQDMGRKFLTNLRFIASACGITASLLWCLIAWYVGRIGKKESEDEFISGMTLTDQPKEVNRLLKKAGEKSDLQIGGLNMVKNAEVMNYLIHGTIGVGKSTLIRWLLDYIRRRGDRAIVYDSGGTFIETHYDERVDKILNAHDSRCENWVLWREAQDVVDYENMTAALMPVEGDSDPFWVSSSRTIFSDTAMQFASRPDRSIETFLKTCLSIDLKSLREFLKNTPSANLVEEKIEKTAISIRSVLTNYAKSLRYLQGLDKEGKPEFSIREWMTDAQYDSSWLFISTTARHRKAVRPLISMWLSLATLLLQSMGENSERRVWFVGDEIASLQKIPEFNETLAEARKFGGCFVIGIQNMPQLIHIYGREMAKAIFDLLNTRAYGRSPSAEVAKIVEEELGHQRRREAREQNSYGLDQVRDGISISKDKVNEPIVDYDQIMKMPNLQFYVRLPGEYPVVKLNLKYRRQKKYHPALLERDFRDRLSPELERIIESNERSSRAANISFPTGEEILEDDDSTPDTSGPASVPVSSAAAPLKAQSSVVRPALHAEREVLVPVPAVMPVTAPTASEAAGDTPPLSNVRPFPLRTVPAPIIAAEAEPLPAKQTAAETSPETEVTPPAPVRPVAPADIGGEASPPETLKPVVRPLMKSKPAGPSALDMLARRKSRAAAAQNSEDNADEAAPQDGAAQGEAPELNMQMEKDDGGRLIVRHISPRKTDQEKREEADARQHSDANARMADDEKNILRHRDDYDAYQEMSDSLDPGGYER